MRADIFKDKVAIISGGSRGVGFAMAKALVQRGAAVVITARTERRLKESEKILRDMGGRAVGVAGDVGSADDCKKIVDAAISNFGRLDILINNAGVSMRGRFEELSNEVCEQVVRTNLMGSIFLTKAAVNHIVQSKGNIVFISSIAGIFGLPIASIYCASKMALTGFSESLRIELIPKGVHVGVVFLGYTEHDPEKRILAADGSPELPNRPAHHTQAEAAELILGMIAKRKRHLLMTPVGVLGWLAHRISPTLVEKAIIMAQTSNIGVFKKFS